MDSNASKKFDLDNSKDIDKISNQTKTTSAVISIKKDKMKYGFTNRKISFGSDYDSDDEMGVAPKKRGTKTSPKNKKANHKEHKGITDEVMCFEETEIVHEISDEPEEIERIV